MARKSSKILAAEDQGTGLLALIDATQTHIENLEEQLAGEYNALQTLKAKYATYLAGAVEGKASSGN